MSEFVEIKNHLIDNLNRIKYENGDLSDIGNEIGIVIGHYIKSDEDVNDFIIGVKHGISLTDGSH
jgi:hypothetical protein